MLELASRAVMTADAMGIAYKGTVTSRSADGSNPYRCIYADSYNSLRHNGQLWSEFFLQWIFEVHLQEALRAFRAASWVNEISEQLQHMD